MRRVRRWVEDHPEWWTVLAAAAGWAALALIPHAHAHAQAAHEHAGHAHMQHDGAAAGGGAGMYALRAGVMTIAMMLPLALTNVRHAASSRSGLRRHVAIAGFVAGFLVVWTPVQMGIDAAAVALGSRAGWIAVLAIAVAAAVWELAPGRRERLLRCHATTPLAATGWRADADCLRYGVVTGRHCVASCWALMALCAAAAHALPVMAAVFA
ncbi:MAG TPA: DUF2182 domain-containing protein, partial [Longimicrobium sp.]|uniref:copper chaperone n=1 Tax=Longimicrobium sp. TaxID=2029185 RepID=UPI002ED997B8